MCIFTAQKNFSIKKFVAFWHLSQFNKLTLRGAELKKYATFAE